MGAPDSVKLNRYPCSSKSHSITTLFFVSIWYHTVRMTFGESFQCDWLVQDAISPSSSFSLLWYGSFTSHTSNCLQLEIHSFAHWLAPIILELRSPTSETRNLWCLHCTENLHCSWYYPITMLFCLSWYCPWMRGIPCRVVEMTKQEKFCHLNLDFLTVLSILGFVLGDLSLKESP